jgi:prepilin-type N-terminal cleavage/methylation domain-containing protein
MNNQKSFKRAFSLIELSIVILIIGILIAGVTQGSRLVNAYKLSTARSLTSSSPVPSIKDLTLWLDSTSETNFLNQDASADISDTDRISAWRDSNPTTTTPISCLQAVAGDRPTYVINTSLLNGLPIVRFNTAPASMRLSCSLSSLKTENTIFIVMNFPSSFAGSWQYFLGIRNGAATSSLYYSAIFSGGTIVSNLYTANPGLADSLTPNFTPGKSYIITKTANPDVSPTYNNLYLNSGSIAATSTYSLSGTMASPTIDIGNGPGMGMPVGADIGEVIIYERALKNEERIAVEKYLGQKWGIKLN